MSKVLRNFWPGSTSKNDDRDDEYSTEYSFAIEYCGPPVSHDIPKVVPVEVHRIPTAAVAVVKSNLSIPVLHPVLRKCDNLSIEDDSSRVPASHIAKFATSGRTYSRKVESFSEKEDPSAINTRGRGASNVFDESSSSSGTLGFSDGRDDSNDLSASSDIEEFDDDNKAKVTYNHGSEASTCNSIEEVEGEDEVSGQGNRASVATFRDMSSSDSMSEESDHDEAAMSPERPVFVDDVKGECHRCNKRSRFGEREVCIVCNAKYCRKCVLRAMGSMPEGRKCISCILHRIDESKRGSLGNCSRMLKKMLTRDAVKQIMSAELSCPVNQLPPNLIFVNDKPLSLDELVILQSCVNPPKKLRPGRYWYDKVSGLWGKEGEKPCQVISPLQAVGNQIRQDASNGDTKVLINGREITNAELWLLWVAGIRCEGNPHFWVTPDGSCQHEGMKNVAGILWEGKQAKMVCMALSLPFPSNRGGEETGRDRDSATAKKVEQSMTNKLLLVGCDQSGTSAYLNRPRFCIMSLFQKMRSKASKPSSKEIYTDTLVFFLMGVSILEKRT